MGGVGRNLTLKNFFSPLAWVDFAQEEEEEEEEEVRTPQRSLPRPSKCTLPLTPEGGSSQANLFQPDPIFQHPASPIPSGLRGPGFWGQARTGTKKKVKGLGIPPSPILRGTLPFLLFPSGQDPGVYPVFHMYSGF